MKHEVIPYAKQINHGVDRNDPQAATTAIEIRFPDTFSYKAWRVIRYFEGAMFLYAYKGQFVVTDESLYLTDHGDGTAEAPFGGPRWAGSSLEELERWLEQIADEYDAADEVIPGWEAPKSAKQFSATVQPPGFSQNVMVKFTRDHPYIAITTYDRLHGRRGRFLVARETLEQVLKPSADSRRDEDCGHYLTITRWEDSLHFRFTWLSSYGDRSVKGFQQDVVIPIQLVRSLLELDRDFRYLYIPLQPKAKIDARPAASTIREIVKDRQLRRAFSKAMRDCFCWPGEHITLYPDGQYSFFFTTRSGCPQNGGLILHEGQKHGYPYVYYSVHT